MAFWRVRRSRRRCPRPALVTVTFPNQYFADGPLDAGKIDPAFGRIPLHPSDLRSFHTEVVSRGPLTRQPLRDLVLRGPRGLPSRGRGTSAEKPELGTDREREAPSRRAYLRGSSRCVQPTWLRIRTRRGSGRSAPPSIVISSKPSTKPASILPSSAPSGRLMVRRKCP